MEDVTKALQELTTAVTRVDERLETLTHRQDEMRQDLQKINESQQTLNSRVAIIESRKIEHIAESVHEMRLRLAMLERESAGNSWRWEKIADLGFKVVTGIVLAVLLARAGLPQH